MENNSEYQNSFSAIETAQISKKRTNQPKKKTRLKMIHQQSALHLAVIYTHTRVYIHTCIYMCVCIYMYTHTHTLSLSQTIPFSAS